MSKKNEETSSKIASIAAKGLANPNSLTSKQIKAVCGSALTQKVSSPKKNK